MLLKDQEGRILVPKHHAYKYIEEKLKRLNLTEAFLFDKKIVSRSELVKLKNEEREGLTFKKFYKLYKGFGDTTLNAASIVYPDLDLTLGEYTPPKRNDFGEFMSQFESNENSPEEIAAKTGIPLPRIKQIYFRTGSPEAYELLLIEKAVSKNSGELFEKFCKKKDGMKGLVHLDNRNDQNIDG